MRWFFAIALLSSGCVFKVRSVDGAVGGDDFGGVDDLAVGGDDLGDLGVGGPDDLVPPPDLMPPVLMLSHVPQHYLTDGTCDLVVTTSIDTSARKVDGNDVPVTCVFANESEAGPPAVDVAVLAVHSIVFNGTVKVTGTRALVVVAGTTIQVNGTLDGSAVKAAAGPGGAVATMGPGAGPSGKHAMGGMTFSDSGGSGGSYGTVGGNGGSGNFGAGDTVASPGTSATYGSSNLTMSVPGGSGGGTGSSEMCNGKNGGPGGAGGGSIQLSAGTSITVAGSGNINVGGGGGGGGCEPATTDEGSGGGGGSGGAVFLESPSVSVSGGLWANGGSGGGGASGDVLNHEGKDGNDATTTQTGASGGAAGGMYGGAGGDGSPPATATSANGAGSANGGGGGGGAGRIVVRSRGAATIVMTKVSPAPALDPSIP